MSDWNLPWCKSLYLSPLQSDVELNIISKDKEFKIPAHSLVLRFNPFFKTVLDGGDFFKEGRERKVAISVRSARVAEYFLRFLYFRNLLEAIYLPDLIELTELAHKYLEEKLLNLCEKRLVSRIETGEVCELYELAVLLGLEDLKRKCISVISKSFDYIVTSGLYYPLQYDHFKTFKRKWYSSINKDDSDDKDVSKTHKQCMFDSHVKRFYFCITHPVISLSDTETSEKSSASNPCMELPGSLLDLFLSSQWSDLELKIEDGTVFPAHSQVLNSQSEVFREMWNQMREADPEVTPRIVLGGANIITAVFLLRFLYIGFLSKDLSVPNLMSLLILSRLYKLQSLTTHCTSLLQDNLSIENGLVLFNFANQENLTSFVAPNLERFLYNRLHFVLNKEDLLKVLSKGSSSMSKYNFKKDYITEWGKWRAVYEGFDSGNKSVDLFIKPALDLFEL